MHNTKKLGSNQSIGLVNAVDKINTPFRKEDREFVNGLKPKRRRNGGDLKFRKFEIRPLKEK